MAEPTEGSATVTADIEEGRDDHNEGNSAGEEEAKRTPNSFRAIRGVEVEKVIVLSFRTLQLKRIADLQDELMSLTLRSAAHHLPDEKVIDKTLNQYAEALRNYETLSQHAQSDIPVDAKFVGFLAEATVHLDPLDPFPVGARFLKRLERYSRVQQLIDILVVSHPLTSGILWSTITYSLQNFLYTNGSSLPQMAIEYLENNVGKLGFRELDQKGREERARKNAFTQRIIMAMYGGAALIGPMLIMTLHPSKNTNLITVSVATFLFALVLAFVARDSAGKDVLASTAAYAAVLVVFVGTSLTPTS